MKRRNFLKLIGLFALAPLDFIPVEPVMPVAVVHKLPFRSGPVPCIVETRKLIIVETRKLKDKWTLEFAEDLKEIYGMELKQDLQAMYGKNYG